MNRAIIQTILLLAAYGTVGAQTPASQNKAANVPSSFARAPEYSDTANENRLVALALKGPEFDGSAHQIKMNELDLKKAKSTWLNLLSVSAQLNNQDFGKPPTINGEPAYVYPKYFFGVTVPLGIIFSQGNTVKTAREAIAVGKDQQETLSRTIRANVLAKYKQYKEYNELIELESELINDVLAVSAQAEENFKNGTITVEAYIGAQRVKNEELAKIKGLQLSQDLVRIDIERMIGIPLKDALYSTAGVPAGISH